MENTPFKDNGDHCLSDNGITYKEINTQSALKKLKRRVPYGWDLNIYRGCQHGCRYCYAMYSHDYLNSRDFFGDIYVKTDIIQHLERELRSDSWAGEVVNIGGVTDSYQPAEAKYRLMPQVLKLMIKYKTPVIISTKSDLILRDFELIDQLSQLTYVNIALTITTGDEKVRKKIEPGSCSAHRRFEVLKEFSKTNASTGVHLMPIIPLLTDGQDNIEYIISHAKECKADYLLPGTLYLRGNTRQHFFRFIAEEYPTLLDGLKGIYETGGADKAYKTRLYEMVNRLRSKYGVSSSYMKPMKEKLRGR
ncbi:MAG: radical SAM protein [Mahellales bacterium]|jgi:DNA repair photolyase